MALRLTSSLSLIPSPFVTASTAARRWLVPFYANTLLVQVVTFVLRPTAIYRAIELDVPAQWLGALGASFAVVPLVLAVPTGHAADRFGERRVMLIGSALTLAAAALFVAGRVDACGASWPPASSWAPGTSPRS